MKFSAHHVLPCSGPNRVFPRAIASVWIAVAVLSFSTPSSHNFADHFRTPEPPRSTARHMFLVQTDDGGAENIAGSRRYSTLLAEIETVSFAPLVNQSKSADFVVSSRRSLFHRKLGRSSSSSEEAH